MTTRAAAHPRILRSAVPDPLALALALSSSAFAGSAHTLKRDTRSVVVRGAVTIAGAPTDVVVKSRRLTRPKDLLSLAAGRTQALRHWRAAEWLASVGVPTAAPLLLFRQRSGVTLTETLVLAAVPGRTLLHELHDLRRGFSALGVRQRHALAAEIGRQITSITRHHRFNRDHKPSNLIVAPPSPGLPPRVAVIDCVGIRRDSARVGAARMLTSLMLEPLGVGCPPPLPLRMRCLAALLGPDTPRSARKTAWRAIARLISDHGDPTPSINPLETPPQSDATRHAR